jgi:hypothetical protein
MTRPSRIKKAGPKGRLKQANNLQGEQDPDEVQYYHHRLTVLAENTVLASVINMTLLLAKSSAKVEINFSPQSKPCTGVQ